MFWCAQRNWIKYGVNDKIKCSRTFEMLTVAFGESTKRAKHKFNCGIIGLRKAEKISITMLVLIARARQ